MSSTQERLRELAHKALDAYLDAGGPYEFYIVSEKDMKRNYWSSTASVPHFEESDFVIPVEQLGEVTPEQRTTLRGGSDE